MKENIKVVIFDADYTLYTPDADKGYEAKFKFLERETGIPSEKIRRVWKEVLEEVKNSKDPQKRRRTYSTRRALEKFGIENSEELAKKSVDVFLDEVVRSMETMKGAEEILERLNTKYDLVVASDEFKGNLKKKLNSFLGDWKDYFQAMITPETTGEMKPSKRYYEAVHEELGYDYKEMIMVGDSWRRDLEPTKKGMETVLINESCEGNPDYHIKELGELRDILGA